jgi:altronate dehydratase small subunit
VSETDPRLLLLHPADNVFVLRDQIAAGEAILVEGERVRVQQALGLGHKLARRPLAPGTTVLKYGAAIGHTSRAVARGEHVHVHNLGSDYTPTHARGGGPASAEAGTPDGDG